MGYLLLTLGVVLTVIFAPRVYKELRAAGPTTTLPLQSLSDSTDTKEKLALQQLQQQVADLEEELAFLRAKTNPPGANFETGSSPFQAYLQEALAAGQEQGTESQSGSRENERVASAEPLAARRSLPAGLVGASEEAKAGGDGEMSLGEQISRAYNSGASIESLAQQFGRGKGEIELILNLHRSKKIH